MKIRKLETKDAPLMLEWMHDESVVEDLATNFKSKTLDDCLVFIDNCKNNEKDLNLAIVDESDEYMGTVSLKHIDKINKFAEFAITIRSCAMGKGYSAYGMKEILRIGIEKIGLEHIYWCVSKTNERAIRFYDKNGYIRVDNVPESIKSGYTIEQNNIFIWYVF